MTQKNLFSIKNLFILTLLSAGLTGCGDSKFDLLPPSLEETENPGEGGEETPGSSERNEQYRPLVHFTPDKNWINDPNGMVYVDGTWHLYYQYNPQGNSWGNMSWGHATSTDLMHWTEQKVAMIRNEWGDIFSGSAILDSDNTAGFGKNAIIAFYTASGEHQQQCMAYSTDGGMTFTQYEGNPVIKNTTLPDFRDPKVFRHEESKQWIMCLALGWSQQIEFWGSKDLKSWNKLSTFTTDAARSNIGQWECPDLIRLPYNGGEKWVLIVSNNPGGPQGGSGTEYFVGDFDGTTFTAMPLDYPLWLDYGCDNYAGVTWSNAPADRKVMIGWMNNWNYCGDVPCDPWRSAMTLPRELSLKDVNGTPLLATTVVKEIDGIAGEWGSTLPAGSEAWEARVTLPVNEPATFRVENGVGQYLEVDLNAAAKRLIAKRNSNSGEVSFHNLFSQPGISAPLNCEGDEIELHIYVDRSSVEITSADGTMCLTNVVYPKEPYNAVSGLDGVEYRSLGK